MLRRTKKPVRVIEMVDALGNVLLADRVDAVFVPESRVVELSVKYFNDPAPCYIHRGAVLSRAFAEIERALEGGEWMDVSELTEEVWGHLSGYSAKKIRLRPGDEKC